MVAEQKDRRGLPGGQPSSDRGIIKTSPMVGARIAGAVRDKFVGVAAEQVYIPLKGGGKLGIVLGGDPKFPEIKNFELKVGLRAE
jgi:hypothetical protein